MNTQAPFPPPRTTDPSTFRMLMILVAVTAVLVFITVLALTATGVLSGSAKEAESTTATDTLVEVTEAQETPEACLDALSHAENLFGEFAEVLDIAAQYPDMIQRAAEAGANLDMDAIDQIAKELEDGNVELEGLHQRTTELRDQYQASAEECRAAS